MNPVEFFFSAFAKHFILTDQEFNDLKEHAQQQYEGSSLQNFLSKYWWVALILPVLLPIVVKGVDMLFEKLIGDVNDDGEVTIEDAIMALADKVMQKKQSDE